MAGFWYFLPDVSEAELVKADRLDESVLIRYGLAEVLEDVHKVPDKCIVNEPRSGPDGLDGVILYPIPTDGQIPNELGYHPDAQIWRKAGPVYIGYSIAAPPRPEELERRRLIPGYTAEDCHERSWIVPILRGEDNPRGRLPVSYGFDEDDKPVIGVGQRYAELWEESASIYDLIDKTVDTENDCMVLAYSQEQQEQLYEFVRKCLAVNYRVSDRELASLGRIDPDWLGEAEIWRMAHAAVDMFKFKQFLRAQKKTGSPSQPDGVNSGLGTEETGQGTDPAEAS